MKEKDGYVDCPEQQVILYVEKDDGTYAPLQTGSFLTKNYIDDYFGKRQRLESSLKAQVTRREISPLTYYMVLEELTLPELAARVGISQRKVRKHADPALFSKIPETVLGLYAEVFNVSVNDLVSLWNEGQTENPK